MPDLIQSSLPYLPATLLPLLLLLLAPLRDESGRAKIAALLALGAIAAVALAISRASTSATLDVYNPFPTGPDMSPTLFLTEHVEAPGWQWPVVAAALLGSAALGVFAALRRPARPPAPVTYCLFLGTLFLAARLAFEKTAAPAGLVWATGTTLSQLLILFFLGSYVAQRRSSFWTFTLSLLLLAVLQRAVLSAVGLLATVNAWGTHLDVNAVTELNTPLMGPRTFAPGDALGKWTWAILVPQMVVWVAITGVVGLVLGGVGYRLNRR